MPILPVEAYLDPDWFEAEQASIFGKTWRFAGLVEDLTETGQYLSVQAGPNNIFVVMAGDGRLRAFHNICRHRGTQLLRATGKTQKAITCPYHDWTYDLEGRLVTVPRKEEEFPDLDMACTGLLKASVDVWRGMLFVHPEPDAGSVRPWFEGIEPYLGPHRPEELVEIADERTEHVIRANWKIVAENYIDVYHLAHLHSGTLSMYDHSKIESGFVGPHFAFYQPLASHYAENLEQNTPMPLIEHGPRESLGAYVPLLFPCLGLAESESSWSIFHIEPIAPEETRVITRTKVANVSSWEFQKQSWRSASFWQRHVKPKFEGDPDTDPLASGDFLKEDIFACEQQQKSLRSPYFSVGASAVHAESAIRQLQTLVEQWVTAGGPPGINPGSPSAAPSKPASVPPPPPLPSSAAGAAPVPTATDAERVGAELRVEMDGEVYEIRVEPGQTLLDAMEEAELDPPYSCTAGVCGTCRTRLVSGQVHMRATMALDDDEIAEGEILACQAEARSDRLEVRYD